MKNIIVFFILFCVFTPLIAEDLSFNRDDTLNTYIHEPIGNPEPIVGYEYFFDTDPGYGNGTFAAVDSTDSLYKDITFDVSDLSHDYHILGVRTKNVVGVWSGTAFYTFYIDDIFDSLNTYIPTSISSPETINKYEYFFDTDPGYTNSYHVNTSSTDSLYKDIMVCIDTLTYDFHTLGIRVMNAANAWSETAFETFFNTYIAGELHIYHPTLVETPDSIVAYEYFLDTDPGYGNANLVLVDSIDSLFQDITIDVTALSHAYHTLGIRAKNMNNEWSNTAFHTIFIFDIFDPLHVYESNQYTVGTKITKAEYFFSDSTGSMFGPYTYSGFTQSDSVYTGFTFDGTGLGMIDPVLLQLTVYNEDNTCTSYGTRLVGISGEVDGEWDSDTWVSGDIEVNNSSTLIIQHGASVHIWKDCTFNISGNMEIHGNQNNPVKFQKIFNDHQWNGVEIDSNAVKVVIDHGSFKGMKNGFKLRAGRGKDYSPTVTLKDTYVEGVGLENSIGLDINNTSCLIENIDIFGFDTGIQIYNASNTVVVVRNNRVRPNASKTEILGKVDTTLTIIPDSLLASVGISAENFDSLYVEENEIEGFNTLLSITNGTGFSVSDNTFSSKNANEYIGIEIFNTPGVLTQNTYDDLQLPIRITNSDNVSIIQDVFYADPSYTDDRIIELYNSSVSIDRVTLADYQTAVYVDESSSCDAINSIFYGNNKIFDGTGAFTANYCLAETALTGSHNIVGDPLFVNYGTQDYHLQESSPCIDAGSPNTPIDPDGTRADLGSFYYEQSLTPAYTKIKIFLESLYDTDSNTMTSNSSIPNTSPYSGLTLSALPSIDGSSIVDWVLIRLKSSMTGNVIDSTDAFLLDDGSIVDVFGNESLPFWNIGRTGYFIEIHHRNHLDIISEIAHSFGSSPSNITTIDLTQPGAIHGSGCKELEEGVIGMYAGDINGDGEVTTADYTAWFNSFIAGSSGYLDMDLNLDGEITTADYTKWFNSFIAGASCSIPEPTKVKNTNTIEYILQDEENTSKRK
jgi:hypothetical protein